MREEEQRMNSIEDPSDAERLRTTTAAQFGDKSLPVFKKKPRGHAHKRLQYNRRFVTVVVGFGKKRGPNSSEK